MLVELFVFLQILCIASFLVGFFRENVWFSSIAMILSGVLIFAAYNIEQNSVVVTNQTNSGMTITYNSQIITKANVDKTWSGINIGIFLLSLVIFLYDLFSSGKTGQLQRKT